ncbi:hypothetical protein N7456_012066 [Penicillium angulare]|uniref:Zn(2)-C6 fungal-type domain-containing protein n=1 Tax=Penicillium angulare TaxID=116970 RepID=A0A9W9EV66_9EURO|nr:hypothetical protein N7456_012066 [Penicillium angulare]
MGGMPWSSKGCVDCRRRKIKCDEQRPECARCLKSGIKCQGWEEHRNFVGAASMSEARKQKKPSTKTNAMAKIPPLTPLVPVSVAPAQAMRIQIFGSFNQRFFTSQTSPLVTFDTFLINSIGNLPRKSLMTEKAVSAISCLFLGKTNSDPAVFNHGLFLYNSAIRQMSNMINRGIYSNELVYAALIFVEINTLYTPNGLNPLGTHIAGLTSLLKYYQSKGQYDPIVDKIHRRHHKLLLAITSTGMNLSQSERDYLMEPTNGDPLLEIIQITSEIGLLKTAIDDDQTDQTACQDILEQCYKVQTRLMRLQEDGHLGKEPSRWQPDYTNFPSPESLFGFAYQFSSLDNALLYTFFWAHMVILQPIIHRARSLVRSHEGTSPKNPTSRFEDPEFVLREAYASKIPRAMPYCFQQSMKLSCGKIVYFPLNMASVHFVDIGDREKLDYFHKVLRHIEALGLESASYIRGLTTHRWERRWDAEDPLDCISLRVTDRPLCNTHPALLADSLLKVNGADGADKEDDLDEPY